MWLQDWTGKRVTSFGDRLWWTWQLDRQRYPGWKAGATSTRTGSRSHLHQPWLVDPRRKASSIRNLYEEAVEKGYTVQTQSGQPI